MATKPNTTTAFIAKLLAPIPADEEQVETKRFVLDLRADMKKIWFGSSDLLTLSRAEHAYRALAPGDKGRDAAWGNYVRLIHKQMMKPAHGRGELKWKVARRRLDGGRPEWDAAIARDELWVARLDALDIFSRSA